MNTFEVEERYKIAGYTFEIIPQKVNFDRVELAVRVTPEGYESFWIKEPEARFETLGGARYAILDFLEKDGK